MEEEVIVTNHAYKRGKERLGWKKKTIDRMADKAFYEEIKHSEVKSKLLNYINGKCMTHRHCNNIRIYGEDVYFFAANRLVTIHRLPQVLIKYIKRSK